MCCGDLTALGRVAGLAARLTPAPSPLARELRRFMRCMSIWALSLGFFLATACLFLGYPFMQTIIFVIGIVVANIPEGWFTYLLRSPGNLASRCFTHLSGLRDFLGLQPTVTASLTITAQRMVKKNCLVKNLEAIEALGACSIICSDKTGTLTENKMIVQHIWTWNRIFFVEDSDFNSKLKTFSLFIMVSLEAYLIYLHFDKKEVGQPTCYNHMGTYPTKIIGILTDV